MHAPPALPLHIIDLLLFTLRHEPRMTLPPRQLQELEYRVQDLLASLGGVQPRRKDGVGEPHVGFPFGFRVEVGDEERLVVQYKTLNRDQRPKQRLSFLFLT